jgi:pilus assembly protein CpaE
VTDPIRVLVAVEQGLNQEGVRATLSIEPDVQVVGMIDGLSEQAPAVHDTPADVTVVATNGRTDSALAFISEASTRQPDRPVVVISDGSPNGFVARAFEAGADDILTVPPAGSVPQAAVSANVLFTLEKAIARRTSMAVTARDLGEMVVVLGPKGGIGKTLATINLAASLADMGNRVVVVDIDLQFGDVGLALGLSPDRTIYDLATSSGSLDEEKIEAYLARHASGARVLLAPSRPDQASAITVDFLRNLYPLLRATNDFVIVDTPPGFTPEVIASIDSATDVCMVGTLDSLSLKNTRLGLETLELMGFNREHVRLLLNRADSRVGITHGDVLAIIGRAPDVMVPSHRDIARSVNEGVPISVVDRRSEGARAFQSLAQMYEADAAERRQEEEQEEGQSHPEARKRWFQRGRAA